ncbi:type II toxin-antitoxin system RelE/ParE family toxin [Marinilabilia sp.]
MATFKIKWTNRAKKDLRKVYNFYSETINEDKSIEIITSLLNKIDILTNEAMVKIGTNDKEFSHLKRNYKKLIEENIKITYRINKQECKVFIVRVFDTRQKATKNQ